MDIEKTDNLKQDHRTGALLVGTVTGSAIGAVVGLAASAVVDTAICLARKQKPVAGEIISRSPFAVVTSAVLLGAQGYLHAAQSYPKSEKPQRG